MQEMLFKCVTEPKHSKQHSRLYLQPLSINLIGLKDAYEEKPINPVTGRRGTSATKKHIKRACALAFVPAQDVPAASSWDEISQQFPVSDKFDAFVTYFEGTWVGTWKKEHQPYLRHKQVEYER